MKPAVLPAADGNRVGSPIRGPANPGWAPRAEYVGGRFWHNLGGFRFEAGTHAAGLESLEWPFRDWVQFFDQPVWPAAVCGRPGKL